MFLDRVRSDMTVKAIEGWITKKYLKKLRLNLREYECTYAGVIISNDVPTIIELIFKSINTATIVSVLNLKDKIR